MTGIGIVRPVYPETVRRARMHVGQVSMPDLVCVFRKLDSFQLTFAAAIKNTNLNLRRIG